MTQQIVSRSDAYAAGMTHFFTGKPCRAGHVSKRYVSTGNCLECQSSYTTKYKIGRIHPRAVQHFQEDLGLEIKTVWVHPSDWPVVEALVDALRQDREKLYDARTPKTVHFERSPGVAANEQHDRDINERLAEIAARDMMITNARCAHDRLLVESCAWCKRA